MSALIPCAVIVDTRNARGQAGKMFGWPRNPTVEGVRQALLGYGLEAVDVSFGVATRTAAGRPSSHLERSITANVAYRDRLREDGATVLEGHLVERASGIEEKQVDVLCAVRVCELADGIFSAKHPAKCIVVLSEDMDLMPAYNFARSRGVTAYAAAYDTVYTRENQRDWMILDEGAMRALVQPQSRSVGSSVRAKVAGIASASERRPLTWTVSSPAGEGRYLMKGNLGAPALWTPGRRVRIGEKASLHSSGLTIHPAEGGRFPHLVLDEREQVEGPLQGVEVGTVAYWQTPTRIKASVGGSLAGLRATPGTLLPGQRIAVLQRTSAAGLATYLIGALERPPAVEGWTSRRSTALVVLEEQPGATGKWVAARVEGTEDRVMVHVGHLEHGVRGMRLRVFLTGFLESRGAPQVMPLTCCLPA